MFFKKKKENINDDQDSILLKKEVKDLFEDHKKVKSDIEYLDSQYEVFVLKSLIVDFSFYKEAIEKDISEGQEKSFWMLDRNRSYGGSSETIHLQKIPDITNKYATRLIIEADHNGKINSEFEVKNITIATRSRKINLSPSKFKDIIFKYIMSHTIATYKRKLGESKKTFEELINLIGKDVHRDTKIDKILE